MSAYLKKSKISLFVKMLHLRRQLFLASSTLDAESLEAGGRPAGEGTQRVVNGRVDNGNEDKAAARTVVRKEGNVLRVCGKTEGRTRWVAGVVKDDRPALGKI